ncbi:MAG: response regulator transcription factor [Planctomycetota bacterium]|nr:response regulator transcription factor [Planctomycetota bacterium]
MTINVAVVEDDSRIRRVLKEVLACAADCQCVGAFAKGTDALESLPALRPDVIVMDVNLPDLSGVECVARLAPQLPGTQIIMLTVYQDPETIFQALAAGAHGYLVKPVMPDKLLEAIREIRAGGVPMSRTIARKVIDVFRGPAPPPAVSVAVEDAALGAREQEILELLVAGLSYKEIAGELSIKVSTVGTYVQRIYEKLHVRSRREIIARYKPDLR